jgi:TetR/AcrR family transcriptional repressor of nem operon
VPEHYDDVVGRPPKYDAMTMVDRAMDVFWVKGRQQTSIRDLEEALDMKAPSIYYRFADKDELFAACLARYRSRIVERRIAAHLPGRGDPIAELEAFFDTAVLPEKPGARSRGCMLNQAAIDGPRLSDKAHREVREGLDSIERAFVTHLETAVERGRIRSDTDVTSLAQLLLVGFQGVLVLARAGESPDRLRQRLRAVFTPVRLAEI